MSIIFPCELVVWKLLPAIKCRLAENLKKEGMKQKDIAKILGVTDAAVSQYLSGKRACDFKVPSDFDDIVDTVVKHLKKSGKKNVLQYGICHICKEIRSSGAACELCQNMSQTKDKCELCWTK